MDIGKWKASIDGAAEATETAARLLVMSRRGSGEVRRAAATDAANYLKTAAKMADDAAKALSAKKATKAPPKAKAASKRAPAKKTATKAQPKAKK